ncbi:MAG: ATP-binding protein [Gemmatimonadota bacterium]|nr:ATP-binding protein [Gemmatimonadota bacterium]
MSSNEAADILLVDDRAENLIALEAILEPLGQRLDRAMSGEEALRRLLAKDYALIVLDVQMPGMTGFELARLIKARERSRHVPIVFLTAISKDERYVFEGYSVGAVDYIAKPFDPDILRSKVAVFVDLQQKRLEIQRQAEQLRDAERRELELRHDAELTASEARRVAELNASEARRATELRAVNEELRRRQVELERAMGARSRFYASMSHELRTPINAILGYNTLLLDGIYGPLAERQTHGLKRVHKAATHLLELVNDVLDLSKIEAGKIELQLQPVPVHGLVEDLFVTVRPMAEERGSTITHTHHGAHRTVFTDARRLRQILLNLLANAIKFGDGKPITVASRPLDGGGAEIEVTDQGIGIAAEDLARIFDEFVQLGKPDGDQGTGLGLAISQRLATLLGGSLDVSSRVGEGSTFRLTLPAAAEVDEPTPGDATQLHHASVR